ncbi:MAG: DUF928 domain-containing protein [Cyanobacteria bacterium P01_H01_bin.130]
MLTPRTISVSSLAIAVLAGLLGDTPAIAQRTAEGAPSPWRWEQLGPIAQGNLEFSPTQPIGAPGRREPAGTNFAPPQDLGAPGRRERAGTRGSRCAQLLLPMFREGDGTAGDVYGYGKTVSDRPKLYLNLASESGEVNLRVTLYESGKSEPIAQVQRRYPAAAGLYAVDLFSVAGGEKQTPPLALNVGTEYHIVSEVACADEVTQDWAYVAEQGVIQRVETGSSFGEQLASAPDALERLNVFAGEGLWVDLMDQVADVARDRPNDPGLTLVWRKILEKLQSDFAQPGGSSDQPDVTALFFQGLQRTPLVVVDPDSPQ